MPPSLLVSLVTGVLLWATPSHAQDDASKRQVAKERREAEFEAPQLAALLGLTPGMTVADMGTGGGAMAIVLGRLVGTGHVYATDITQRTLTITSEYAKNEGLTNRNGGPHSMRGGLLGAGHESVGHRPCLGDRR